jgi:hypothetical protein
MIQCFQSNVLVLKVVVRRVREAVILVTSCRLHLAAVFKFSKMDHDRCRRARVDNARLNFSRTRGVPDSPESG